MADETTRKSKVLIEVRETGADEVAKSIENINKGATNLQKELAGIGRGDDLKRLGTEFGKTSVVSNNLAKSVDDLNKKLKALGATEGEIKRVAAAFANARKEAQATANSVGNIDDVRGDLTGGSGGEGGGGGLNKITRFGNQLRSLPSIQTGLGFGTDAVANVIRVTGAVGEFASKSAIATAATNLLIPALGAQAAGVLGVVAAAAPFAAALAVIALAIKHLVDTTSSNVAALDSYVKGIDAVNQAVQEGQTTEDVATKLEKLNKVRQDEQAKLDDLQGAYNKVEQDLKNATVAGISLGNTFSNTAKIFSGDEQKLADEIANSQKKIADATAEIGTFQTALEDGTFAANDAAIAEQKLAEERSKTALSSADAAGKELAAQQRALGATEETNLKRLETIDNERAVLEKQISVLEASGVTSEEVTARIAALTAGLTALGGEADFINSTALEASRAADAEKKAKKDAEDAAKKAEVAQSQYTKSVENATRSFTNAQEDIGAKLKNTFKDLGTKLSNSLTDNNTKLAQDLNDINTKFSAEEYELTLKSNRSERDALKDQLRDIEDVRRDAQKDELQAIQDGDFKALFLARQAKAETFKDTTIQLERESQDRAQSLADAREDLLRNTADQRTARLQAFDRQNADTRLNNSRELAQAQLASQRELQQAQLNKQRALQLASEAYNAELAQLGNYLSARQKLEGEFYKNSLGMASGQSTSNVPRSGQIPVGVSQSVTGTFGRIVKRG